MLTEMGHNSNPGRIFNFLNSLKKDNFIRTYTFFKYINIFRIISLYCRKMGRQVNNDFKLL